MLICSPRIRENRLTSIGHDVHAVEHGEVKRLWEVRHKPMIEMKEKFGDRISLFGGDRGGFADDATANGGAILEDLAKNSPKTKLLIKCYFLRPYEEE